MTYEDMGYENYVDKYEGYDDDRLMEELNYMMPHEKDLIRRGERIGTMNPTDRMHLMSILMEIVDRWSDT